MKPLARLCEIVDEININQVFAAGNLAASALKSVSNPKVTILGLSFKGGTDDTRESPAIKLVQHLSTSHSSWNITAHNPIPVSASLSELAGVTITNKLEIAVQDADLIIVATDWSEFRQLDPEELGSRVRSRTILDARSLLDETKWVEAGWLHLRLGKRA